MAVFSLLSTERKRRGRIIPKRKMQPKRGRKLRTAPRLENLEDRVVPAGTWTPLAHVAPEAIGTMMLLPDGTVMAQGNGQTNHWYKLAPDSSGSYANGTWTARASMRATRLYFASNVLTDGRVFVEGGEYSSDGGFTRTGEIYNPVTNTWANIANFPLSQFGDDPSELLPDGRVLAGHISTPATYVYNPTTDTWTFAANKLRNDQSDEETWIKLPDNSILSYDVFSSIATGVNHAQRYVPATNTWVDAGTLPPPLLTSTGVGEELGPAFLLPDGRVWQIGATNHTAFYQPATNTWTAGPDLPAGMGADDAPGAPLPNGHVLFTADVPLFRAPTKMFDFDPTTNTLTDVTSTLPSALQSVLSGNPSYPGRMLVLPSGQILFAPNSFSSNQLYVYTPDGSADPAWKPTISSITDNGDGSFTLTGTQLNGISGGASYGDDAEMDSNYPLVRLVTASGQVFYARTFNWNNTGVATGSTVETVKFTVPTGVDIFSSSVFAVANGIASDAFFLGLRVTGTTPSGNVPGSMNKIRVAFNEAIQPATFTTDQVVLKDPGNVAIPVTITAVAGTGNQQFDLSFTNQTTLGHDSLTIGPNVMDLAGRKMDQDGDGVAGEVPDDQFISTLTVQGLQVTASSAFRDHVRLTFNEPFDPNTLTADQIVAFTGPGGAIDLSDATLTAVPGSNNTQADVNFDPQSALGNYDLTVGPAIKDLAGHQMDQNNNFIDGETPGDQYHARWTIVQPRIVADSGIAHGASFLPGALRTVQEQVTFNSSIDPTTFTPDQVQINGQSGSSFTATSVTPVAGSNNTRFVITFAADATDKYTMVIGPTILDIFGNAAETYSAITFNVLGPKITGNTSIPNLLPGTVGRVDVTFNEPMDPTTFTADQVVVSGAGTAHSADSVTPVAGSNNTRFTIAFTATTTGRYTLVIGPNVFDPFGNAMDQNGNFVTGEVPGDQYAIPFNVLGPRINFSTTGGDSQNQIYSSVRVTFNEPMDPTTFTTDQVRFTGPGGTIAVNDVVPVAGSNNTQFDVLFNPQGRLGNNYALVIGPNVLDTFGNAMDQNGNFVTGEVPGDQYVHRFTITGPQVTFITPSSPSLEPVNSIRVFFNKPIDVSTFTPSKLSNFNGPNGPIGVDGVFVVPGSNNTQFDIAFRPQSATGNYSLVIGPDVRDLAGNRMDQNNNFIDGEIPGDQYVARFGVQGPRILSSTSGNFLPGTLDHVRVTFNEPMNASTFTPAKVVSFTGPGGDVAVTQVTAVPFTDNTQFDVAFDPLAATATGRYSMVIGPDVRDLYGNPMDQNNNLIPGEVPGDRYTLSFGIQGPRVTASTPGPNGFAHSLNTVHVTFNEPIDPNTFTPDKIVSFTGPNGAIAVTAVTATSDSDFDITFATQATLGSYTMVIGPNVQDFYGNPMDQNNNLIPGEIPGDQYRLTFTLTNKPLVLYVGFNSIGWNNDGSLLVTQVFPSQFATQSLAGFDEVWLDESISNRDPNVYNRAADLAAFVRAGGGLITDAAFTDYGFVPTSSTLTAVRSTGDDVRETTLGQSHPILAGITDAGLSNWNTSRWAFFSETGGLDVLATSSNVTQPVLLAGTFGAGRVVVMGQIPTFYWQFNRGQSVQLLRQAAKWASAFQPAPTPPGDSGGFLGTPSAAPPAPAEGDFSPADRVFASIGKPAAPASTSSLDGVLAVNVLSKTSSTPAWTVLKGPDVPAPAAAGAGALDPLGSPAPQEGLPLRPVGVQPETRRAADPLDPLADAGDVWNWGA